MKKHKYDTMISTTVTQCCTKKGSNKPTKDIDKNENATENI